MPRTRTVDVEMERTKRQLRLEIARLRRRIDGGAVAVGREASRLLSWRTYVRRYPAAALAVVFSAGAIVSAGRVGSFATSWLGRRLIASLCTSASRQAWQELAAVLRRPNREASTD